MYGNLGSITAGWIICVLLLFKTSSWKRHFCAILIPASIFIILFRFLLIPSYDLEGPAEVPFLRAVVLIVSFTPISSFFLLYVSKLVHTETPDLRAILIRTVKFSIAVILFFAAFLILRDFGYKQGISRPVRLLFISLLAICFLVICYIFDCSLIERKKKGNRISELRNELNDFYLEERAKIKK